MARATKEEALNAKIAKNAQAIAKVVEKLEVLKEEEAELKKQLAAIDDAKKKAEKASIPADPFGNLKAFWGEKGVTEVPVRPLDTGRAPQVHEETGR